MLTAAGECAEASRGRYYFSVVADRAVGDSTAKSPSPLPAAAVSAREPREEGMSPKKPVRLAPSRPASRRGWPQSLGGESMR